MDINRTNMNELFRGYNLIFQKGLESASHEYQKYCTEVRSGTAVEVYPFLEQFGGMREWIGDREIKNVSSQKLSVANRDFEDTVSVKRNDIEDDKYGLYSHLIQTLGFNAAEIWGDLAVAALTAGESANWIDELPFFSTTRKYGEDAVIANLGTSALSIDSYAAARLAMLQFRGHNNRPLKVRPNLLICGPANEGMAFDILKNSRRITAQVTGSGDDAKVITGSVDNPYAGTAEVLILPELGSEWFLADTTKPLKPVIVQKRKEPVLTRLDREDDDNVFFRKEFIYGADCRGEAFTSFPHLIFGSFPN